MEVSSCLCAVCGKLPDVVVESPCCHSLFCWECVLGLNNENSDGFCLCPSCSERVQVEQFRENFAVQKIIDNMIVDCNFEECDSRFAASTRSAHENSCLFAPALCPHSDLCGIMTKGTLQQHEGICAYRIVMCHLCGTPVTAGVLANHLSEVCTDAYINCINQCGAEGIKRSSMEAHLTNACPFTIVSCPYKINGCNEEFAREAVEVHLQSRAGVHLQMLAASIEPFQQYTMALRNEVDVLRDELSELRETNIELHQEVVGLREEIANVRTQASMVNNMNHLKNFMISLSVHLVECARQIRPMLPNITIEKVLPYLVFIGIVLLLVKTLNPFKQILLFGFLTWFFITRFMRRDENRARGGGR